MIDKRVKSSKSIAVTASQLLKRKARDTSIPSRDGALEDFNELLKRAAKLTK